MNFVMDILTTNATIIAGVIVVFGLAMLLANTIGGFSVYKRNREALTQTKLGLAIMANVMWVGVILTGAVVKYILS